MGHDAFTPGTTKQRLSLPLNGTIYVTTREVASEKPLPAVGATMEAELGSAFATSYIIAVSDSPNKSGQVLAITHATIPAEAEQLASNWEHTTCDIGGQKFDGVSRTVIMLASAYSEASPATGSAMPTGTPFTASNYLLENRQTVRSGIELEPVFRVERRSYVKRVTIREINADAENGIANFTVTTLFYRGENTPVVKSTGPTVYYKIEELIALPENDYWSTDSSGYGREAQQLSENWFSVVYRQVLNTDTEYRKERDRRRPPRFFCPQDVETSTVVTTNNTPGEPDMPTAEVGQSVEVQQKGRIRRLTTAIQTGTSKILRSLKFLSDDGKLYPQKEELVSPTDVPVIPSKIASDGTIIEYEAIDACNAAKITRQAVSLENDYQKEASLLYPERFVAGAATARIEVTATGVITEPVQPTGQIGREIVVKQKGAIRTTATTYQLGDLVSLRGLDANNDGYSYPSLQNVVPMSSVPMTPQMVDSNGRIRVYQPHDANFAIEELRQDVSLKPGYQKTVTRLKPQKFYKDQRQTVTVTTEAGVVGMPANPVPVDGAEVNLKQTGAVRVTTTTAAVGNPVPLYDLDPLDDGYAYPTKTTIVDLSEVPPARQKIASTGIQTTFQAQDANFALKVEKQVESLEQAHVKDATKLVPERFIPEGKTAQVVTVTCGVTGDPVQPTAINQQSVKVIQKGGIRKKEIITQQGSPVPLFSTTTDPRTGEGFREEQTVVPRTSVIARPVDASGRVTIFDPLDATHAIKTVRQLRSGRVQRFTEIRNYEWPPVLLSLTFKIWEAKLGRGSVVYPVPKFRRGFQGPQEFAVTQYWQKATPTVIPARAMIADGFQYRCPLYAISVPPCLHKTIVLRCEIRGADPEWESAIDTEVFPATNYVDWPADIFWREAQPDAGGFLVTEYRVKRPQR